MAPASSLSSLDVLATKVPFVRALEIAPSASAQAILSAACSLPGPASFPLAAIVVLNGEGLEVERIANVRRELVKLEFGLSDVSDVMKRIGDGEAGSSSGVARTLESVVDAMSEAGTSGCDEARFALGVALWESGSLEAFSKVFGHVLKAKDYGGLTEPSDVARAKRGALFGFLLGRKDFFEFAQRARKEREREWLDAGRLFRELGAIPGALDTWESQPGNVVAKLATFARVKNALTRLAPLEAEDRAALSRWADLVEDSVFREEWKSVTDTLRYYREETLRGRYYKNNFGGFHGTREVVELEDPCVEWDAFGWHLLLEFLGEGGFQRAAHRMETEQSKSMRAASRTKTAGKTPIDVAKEAFALLACGQANAAMDLFLKLEDLRMQALVVADGWDRADGPFWFPALLAGVAASMEGGVPEAWIKRVRAVEATQADAPPWYRTIVFLCSLVNFGQAETPYRVVATRRVAELMETRRAGFYAPFEGDEITLARACADFAAIGLGIGTKPRPTGEHYRWLEALSQPAFLRAGETPSFAFLAPGKAALPAWVKQVERIEDVLGISRGRGRGDERPANETERKPRLLWRLEVAGQTMSIAALEQSSGKDRWGAPRHVSVSKLVQPNARKNYDLEPIDLELLACARHSTPENGWRKEWHIPWASALESLARHPRVFVQGGGTLVPLRISLRKPEVVLVRDSKGYSFHLAPSGMNGEWLWWWLAQDELAIARLDEKASKVADLLQGCVVPADAGSQERIAAFLGVLSSNFDLGIDKVVHPEPNQTRGAEESPVVPGALESEPVSYPLTLRVERSSWGAECEFLVSVSVSLSGDRGRALPGDGPAAFLLREEGKGMRWVTRDLEEERERLERLRRAWEHAWHKSGCGFHLGSWEELAHLLDFIAASGTAYTIEWPGGGRPLVSTLEAIALKIPSRGTLDGGVGGWFVPGDRTARELEARGLSLEALMKTVRASKETFVALEGGGVLALGEKVRALLETLALLGIEEGKERAKTPHRVSEAALFALAQAHPEAIENAEALEGVWAAKRPALRDAHELPTNLAARLRGYQSEGVEWIHSRWARGLGCCLADDMGLGKTLQAVAALELLQSAAPALVVCPTSVVGNWLSELARFGSSWRARAFPGMAREAFAASLREGDLCVVSYQSLERNKALFEGVAFSALILDEAQMLKNADAKRTAAVAGVRATFRLALSGTPVENRIEEIHSLMDVLNPGLFGSAASFRRRFAGGPTSDMAAGERKALARVLRPFLLRRTRERVLVELPSRVEETRLIAMNDDERLTYEAFRSGAVRFLEGPDVGTRDRFKIFAWLTRLRQVCSHPVNVEALKSEGGVEDPRKAVAPRKARAGAIAAVRSAKEQELLDLLAENKDAGKKTLVFSQFLPTLETLHGAARDEGFRASLFVGETTREERDALVTKFQAGEADVLFMSLRAGGLGVNLTEADCVVHFDPWWNPALEAQATARAHRMGRRGTVHVVRFCYTDSVEERIIALHEQKRRLSDDLLGASKSDEGSVDFADGEIVLSLDEIKALLTEG